MSEALKQQLDRVGKRGEVAEVLDIVAHDLRNAIATVRMECAVLAHSGGAPAERIRAIAANLERTMDNVAEMVSIMERFVEEHDEADEGAT